MTLTAKQASLWIDTAMTASRKKLQPTELMPATALLSHGASVMRARGMTETESRRELMDYTREPAFLAVASLDLAHIQNLAGLEAAPYA